MSKPWQLSQKGSVNLVSVFPTLDAPAANRIGPTTFQNKNDFIHEPHKNTSLAKKYIYTARRLCTYCSSSELSDSSESRQGP